MLSEKQKSAVKKSKMLVEFLEKNNIKTPFKVEAGVCHNYEKMVYGGKMQMQVHEPLCIYWKSAYLRLYQLKKMIENPDLIFYAKN